jgi:ubiquinone/menaquinone biosynthesis C-methylase UbiE
MFFTVGTKNQQTCETWLEDILKNIPIESRILDVGAGEQAYKKFCTHLNYVSQDFSHYVGKGDGRSLHTNKWDNSNLDIVSDITKIPEPDSSFDAVMCIEVFEHLLEPILAIKEFNQLLKSDGHLIITAPFCSLIHMVLYHFYSGYNRYFYEKHLVDYGFKIIELTENGNFFEYLAQELRRLPRVKKDYTGGAVRFGLIDRIAQHWLLRTLEHSSKNDHGSKDLLNFSFHAHAIKER